MTGPADAVADLVCVLEPCLREQSGGSMTAALRDVWHMAPPQELHGHLRQRAPPAGGDRPLRLGRRSQQTHHGPAHTIVVFGRYFCLACLRLERDRQFVPGLAPVKLCLVWLRLNCPWHATVRWGGRRRRVSIVVVVRLARVGAVALPAPVAPDRPSASIARPAPIIPTAPAERPENRQYRPNCQRACNPHLSAGVPGRVSPGTSRHVITVPLLIPYHAGVTASSGKANLTSLRQHDMIK